MKKNPPDATRREVAELRRRVKALETAVKTLGKRSVFLAQVITKLCKASSHRGLRK